MVGHLLLSGTALAPSAVLQWRKETKGASGLYREMSFFAWTPPAEKGRSQTLTSVALPEMGVHLKKRQTHSRTMSINP